jgi:hypothetical protein
MFKEKFSQLDDLGRKQCPQCKEFKELTKYAPSSRNKLKVQSWCKDCTAKRTNSDYTYEKARESQLKHSYGITTKEYIQMLEDQHGVCACCGQAEKIITGRSKRSIGTVPMLHVDHSHSTGAVRGLLCSSCNAALGLLSEDPDRVKLLLKYIEERVLW